MSPKALWDKSLPFRVVVITLVASIGILAGTGFFLLSRSSEGIIEGKTQASLSEATSVLEL
ncbi:MAG: two-component sensor histidine kinase, partial [Propionibacteriaceae bacterium]|nr:two-component sensor histidine kinase [Propionibacteriaceae bacterium]